MLRRLHLRNVGPAPEMELDLGSRLNLITGDNGLGKSFLLDVAWWALTRKWPRELNPQLTSGYPAKPTDRKVDATIQFQLDAKTRLDVGYSSRYSANDESWTGKQGRPSNPGLVIYAHADGSFSVWDPARNYWNRKGNIDIQDRLPGYVFSPGEVWDGLVVPFEGKQIPVCEGLIRDWANWIRGNGVDADNMAKILKFLSPNENELLVPGRLTRISINEPRDIPTISTGYSDSIPILHASSGVRRIVALAYMLLWTWREHLLAADQLNQSPAHQVTLLVDELESHLHPKWQRTILGSLLKLVEVLHRQARIQIIAATHSPLIMASAEPHFDPNQDAWFDLDLNRETQPPTVELRKRPFERRGSVGRWLTSEAFDLGDDRSLEAEQAIKIALELVRQEHPSDVEIQTVDKKLRATLGEIDRFWARWEQFRDSRKGPA